MGLLMRAREEGSTLPRYFLHILTLDGRRIEDLEGFDLPDMEAARQEALAGAGEILAHAIRSGQDLKDEAILITDEQGRDLERIAFVDAVPRSLRERLRTREEPTPDKRPPS